MPHCQISYRSFTPAAAPTEHRPTPEPVYGLRHILTVELAGATKASAEAHLRAILPEKSRVEVLAVSDAPEARRAERAGRNPDGRGQAAARRPQ